jgi:hypothetical protein
LTIANLGHATVLINYFGVRVLTGPALLERVGLAIGSVFSIGRKRISSSPLAPHEFQNLSVISL